MAENCPYFVPMPELGQDQNGQAIYWSCVLNTACLKTVEERISCGKTTHYFKKFTREEIESFRKKLLPTFRKDMTGAVKRGLLIKMVSEVTVTEKAKP
ncbi:MAG: hypothetical protein WCW02_00855 [Candidatus Buchananbacteria bacterium]